MEVIYLLKKQAMKTLLLFLSFFCAMCYLPIEGQSQSNPYYLQGGVGTSVLSHHQQLGFKQTSAAKFAYVEGGRERSMLRFGLFYSQGQQLSFFTYQLEEELKGLYVKLNLGPFISFLPYGIDPYLFGSAAMKHDYFKQEVMNSEGLTEMQKITQMSFSNSVGAGVDIGRKILVLGLQYNYTPGKANFLRPDGDALEIFTSKHAFTVSLGIRIRPQVGQSGMRCPRFGKRSKGNTSF